IGHEGGSMSIKHAKIHEQGDYPVWPPQANALNELEGEIDALLATAKRSPAEALDHVDEPARIAEGQKAAAEVSRLIHSIKSGLRETFPGLTGQDNDPDAVACRAGFLASLAQEMGLSKTLAQALRKQTKQTRTGIPSPK